MAFTEILCHTHSRSSNTIDKAMFCSVKGMNLVRELERDLKVANVICMVRTWKTDVNLSLVFDRELYVKHMVNMIPYLP